MVKTGTRIFTREPSGRVKLRPPTRSDKLSTEEFAIAEGFWLDDVRDLLVEIHQSACGGVMVLMTSYDSVEKLAARLPAELREVATVANQDDTLTDQRTKFLKQSKVGPRPIWIAVGGAWTGLDVGGHDPWKELFGEALPASEDNVLTDLLIPRIPYGLNKSMPHAHRIAAKPAVPWELLDTMFRLKQGIGRLIRREGLPKNRRIFLSDARINEVGYFQVVRAKIEQIVRRYNLLEQIR